jgi:hydrogenase maturation protease
VSACIVGVGEPLAGDDGAGIAVIERLRAGAELSAVALHALRDPSELLALLPEHERALVIDARLEPEAVGRVDRFELGRGHALGPRPTTGLSSHGLDTLTAVEIGRTLAEDGHFPSVTLLTIAIARPDRLARGLSPRVSEAVDEAARRALAWATEREHA